MENLPKHLRPFLSTFTKGLVDTLNEKLAGVYIHGSLTYGGYVKERSDVDILVIVKIELDEDSQKVLSDFLSGLSNDFPEEVKNIELDVLLLEEIQKRPDILNSQFTFMDNHPVGPEKLDGFWIELANARDNGITLYGSTPTSTIPEIDKGALIQANKEKFADLQKNAVKWEKIDLWNQTYILVQASRVLYSLNNDLKLTAKQDAIAWAVNNVPEQFTEMLKIAQAKLDNFEGPREQVISDNWQDYFEYVEKQFPGS